MALQGGKQKIESPLGKEQGWRAEMGLHVTSNVSPSRATHSYAFQPHLHPAHPAGKLLIRTHFQSFHLQLWAGTCAGSKGTLQQEEAGVSQKEQQKILRRPP